MICCGSPKFSLHSNTKNVDPAIYLPNTVFFPNGIDGLSTDANSLDEPLLDIHCLCAVSIFCGILKHMLL